MLLLTQLMDLRLPTVLALNMVDLAAKSGQSIDIKNLEKELDLPVVMLNARNGTGIERLKSILSEPLRASSKTIYKSDEESKALVSQIKNKYSLNSDYEAYQFLQQSENLMFLSKSER